MRACTLLSLLLSAAVILVGCGRAEDDVVGSPEPGKAAEASRDGYNVVMRGVVNDTLSGAAQFGDVFDSLSGDVTGVIELTTSADFAGGMFLTPGSDQWPATGNYPVNGNDGANAFTIAYRQGLYRIFQSRSGSITLTHVSDSLISGRFDAVLIGEVAEGGREPVRGEVNVSGSFSAQAGQPGYIIGP